MTTPTRWTLPHEKPSVDVTGAVNGQWLRRVGRFHRSRLCAALPTSDYESDWPTTNQQCGGNIQTERLRRSNTRRIDKRLIFKLVMLSRKTSIEPLPSVRKNCCRYHSLTLAVRGLYRIPALCQESWKAINTTMLGASRYFWWWQLTLSVTR